MTVNNNKIKTLAELGKVRIALPVTLSCLTGYILLSQEFSSKMFSVLLGVFFIVAGASAINHIQEYKRDAKMERTRFRPIPTGDIDVPEAIRWAVFFLLIGCGFLAWGGNAISLWLAILSLSWYNLVYTPLKTKSAFAVIPGALCGAFPPLIGWTAAGGELFSSHILALAFFFFIGQIPHFWLLLLLHSKDYKKAGFKVLTDLFSISQIHRITSIWMLATVAMAMLLPVYQIISSHLLCWILLVISFWILPNSLLLLRRFESATIRKLFIRLNFYFLMVMVLIGIDHLLL